MEVSRGREEAGGRGQGAGRRRKTIGGRDILSDGSF
jgi:hypothetical protein